MSEQIIYRPQVGPQEAFINMPPDVNIVFYGGAAGKPLPESVVIHF